MSEHLLGLVRYCASETERQGRGPLQVADMFNALDHARMCKFLRDPEANDYALGLTLKDVMTVANLVESTDQLNPFRSSNNWRQTVVTRGEMGPVIGAEPPHIDRQMHLWFEAVTDMCEEHKPSITTLSDEYGERVEELIKHLLDIHPWRDGNGRTASIIRNWLLLSMDHPQPLPFYYTETCEACEGSGTVMGTDPGDPEYLVPEPCGECEGEGFVEKR